LFFTEWATRSSAKGEGKIVLLKDIVTRRRIGVAKEEVENIMNIHQMTEKGGECERSEHWYV